MERKPRVRRPHQSMLFPEPRPSEAIPDEVKAALVSVLAELLLEQARREEVKPNNRSEHELKDHA
jgi:hypothetical protein